MTGIRETTLARMEDAYAEADAVLQRVPVDQLAEVAATDDWSVRDLLAHIAGYERFVGASVMADLRGTPATNRELYGREDAPTPEDDENDDTTNAWVVAHARSLPVEEIVAEYHAAHRLLVEAVRQCTDADLQSPSRFPSMNGRSLLDVLPGQCWGHHAEHLPQLREAASRL